MTAGVEGDCADSELRPEISAKSWTGWQGISVPSSSSGPKLTQDRWVVHICPSEHQIIRVACYHTISGTEIQEYKESDEVIWPTWPATIEDETAVAATPLADLQRYWAGAGNRLRDSAKWMATVLGAALAAIVGTSPLANLSSHHFQVAAAVIGPCGLLCLATTMLLVLRVLQPPEVSFEQIESAGKHPENAQPPNRPGEDAPSSMSRHEKSTLGRWKQKVESHRDLYLPSGVNSLPELRWSIGLEEATLVQLTRSGESAADKAAAKRVSSAEEARAARLLELRTAATRITSIGEYYALQARSTQARYGGTAFGFLGTALIVLAFSWPLK